MQQTELAALRLARGKWPGAMFACAADPRFCYALHVPERVAAGHATGRLLVAVHGSGRDATGYRDALAPFADAHDCVVLAPLFPIGVRGDGHADGYKYLDEPGIRYDLVLLAMVAEVAAMLDADDARFLLFGFSGGGHFAHRMLYLHPHRLTGVSVGAPGAVTLIDPARDWWRGTRNVPELFGVELDMPALRRVPVQLLVGAEDTQEFGAPELGRNRIERLEMLRRNLVDQGLSVRHGIVPGIAHEGLRMVPDGRDVSRGDSRARCGEVKALPPVPVAAEGVLLHDPCYCFARWAAASDTALAGVAWPSSTDWIASHTVFWKST